MKQKLSRWRRTVLILLGLAVLLGVSSAVGMSVAESSCLLIDKTERLCYDEGDGVLGQRRLTKKQDGGASPAKRSLFP